MKPIIVPIYKGTSRVARNTQFAIRLTPTLQPRLDNKYEKANANCVFLATLLVPLYMGTMIGFIIHSAFSVLLFGLLYKSKTLSIRDNKVLTVISLVFSSIVILIGLL